MSNTILSHRAGLQKPIEWKSVKISAWLTCHRVNILGKSAQIAEIKVPEASQKEYLIQRYK